jgi:hypothetical protein
VDTGFGFFVACGKQETTKASLLGSGCRAPEGWSADADQSGVAGPTETGSQPGSMGTTRRQCRPPSPRDGDEAVGAGSAER